MRGINERKFKGDQTLAASLYELYYKKSGVRALAELDKNKVAIKAELAKMKTGPGNSTFVHDDVRRVLDKIIYDMWINKYPGDGAPEKTTSDKAYDLFDFFED